MLSESPALASMFMPRGVLVTTLKSLDGHVAFDEPWHVHVSPRTAPEEVAIPEEGVGVEVGTGQRCLDPGCIGTDLGPRSVGDARERAVHGAAHHPGDDCEGQEEGPKEGARDRPSEPLPRRGHSSGTDMAPRLTNTAEPPTRTAEVVPSARSASTWRMEGRPISRPCSTVQ